MGDQGSLVSMRFRDASKSSVLVVMRLSNSLIRGMSLMVSVLFMIKYLIFFVCSIMLCFFTNTWRCCLYFITRLVSFDCNNLLYSSMLS